MASTSGGSLAESRREAKPSEAVGEGVDTCVDIRLDDPAQMAYTQDLSTQLGLSSTDLDLKPLPEIGGNRAAIDAVRHGQRGNRG